MSNDSVMHFQFMPSPGLPKLAWLLEIEYGSNAATVVHGDWVETSDNWFSEGSWAGDFGQAMFADQFMTGTGARLQNDAVMLVSPNHTLDRLNVLRKGTRLYASNSLPFILAWSGEDLDNDFLFYDSYIASIRYGLKAYERSIPTLNKIPVTLYYCSNIIVNRRHEVTEVPKQSSPSFANYAEYRAYLDETIRKVGANSADRRRKVPYTPMATISRGYDSPTAAVLAMGVGCNQAISFRESRGTAGDEDCGTLIAKMLGLSVREFGRLDYRQDINFPEIRNSGGPSEFLSFGDHLRGTLLFTGFNGDMVWNKNPQSVSSTFVRTDASGVSLTEYRLDTGFAHLPVPFIGADSHPSICAISNSNEMAQWSLGSSYDRPIARRIVEEAGIGRQLFGQKKRAAGVVVTSEGLAATLSEQSLRDFDRFVSEKWNTAKAIKTAWFSMIKKLTYYNDRAIRVGARVGRAFGIRFALVPNLVPHRLGMLVFGYIGKESMLFHWGVTKLVLRYKAAVPFRQLRIE
jgi:hypothetical protein